MNGDSGKKRSTNIRATQRQLEILRNAFTQSTATSKDLLKRLSDETGLSTKWIVSWYTRQRKKRKDSGDTSSDPAMSPEEIANFKTEYREPALETRTFTAQPVLPNPEKREGQPPKRRRGRPPKLKVQAKQHNGENTLASNQPSSVLLAIHPTPPSLEKALCPSSSMRPIAPRMNPPSSFQAHQFPVPPIIVSNSLEHVDMPNPSINYHSAPASLRPVLQPAIYANTEDPNRLSNPVRILAPHQDLHSTNWDENSPFIDHSRVPIARRLPYPSGTTQWPSRLSSASLAKLPLFTRNALSFSSSLAYLNSDATSVETLSTESVTVPCTLGIDPYTSLLDSSKAPLKHLTVIHSCQMDYVEDTFDTANVMIDRLLDEKLAESDPFQATMGLVFLSQLGLEWNHE